MNTPTEGTAEATALKIAQGLIDQPSANTAIERAEQDGIKRARKRAELIGDLARTMLDRMRSAPPVP